MNNLLNKATLSLRTRHLFGEDLKPLDLDLLDLINIDSLSVEDYVSLKRRLSKITLLANGKTNPKTAKTLAGYEFNNYIMHLSPAKISGMNVCPKASKGCAAACLNSAGRGKFSSVQLARLRKTLYFRYFKVNFLQHLDKELTKISAKAVKTGVKAAVRLNGTSDILFENYSLRLLKTLPELYPDIQFYDYTKISARLKKVIPNYHFTFSAAENNWSECSKALWRGINVAVVFDTVPKEYKGFKVLDGDSHDFRFLDPVGDETGFIIGLKAKGDAKKDISGFVHKGNSTGFEHITAGALKPTFYPVTGNNDW